MLEGFPRIGPNTSSSSVLGWIEPQFVPQSHSAKEALRHSNFHIDILSIDLSIIFVSGHWHKTKEFLVLVLVFHFFLHLHIKSFLSEKNSALPRIEPG